MTKQALIKTKDRQEVDDLYLLAGRLNTRGDMRRWGKVTMRAMLLSDLLDVNDNLSVSRKEFNELYNGI